MSIYMDCLFSFIFYFFSSDIVYYVEIFVVLFSLYRRISDIAGLSQGFPLISNIAGMERLYVNN